MKRARVLLPALDVAVALVLAGCAATASPPAGLVLHKPVVLLGEVHDNATQHALRLRAFEALLATGARPALLMEQFDRQHQGEIDRLLAQRPRPDADTFIAAVTAPRDGWNWAHYKPFVALALRTGLPIVAANVGREEARGVMRQGLAASGFDAAVPADIEAGTVADVLASHCGLIDDGMARRMAQAQFARDQFMARAIEQYADRGLVLLAGNGHVRIDRGVPRWLSPGTRARSEAIGLLEAGSSNARDFDRVVYTERQERPDPCAGMQKPSLLAPP
ncbi:MAG TPA: ChaN family lipoprotein [Rubrivivax sp.]